MLRRSPLRRLCLRRVCYLVLLCLGLVVTIGGLFPSSPQAEGPEDGWGSPRTPIIILMTPSPSPTATLTPSPPATPTMPPPMGTPTTTPSPVETPTTPSPIEIPPRRPAPAPLGSPSPTPMPTPSPIAAAIAQPPGCVVVNEVFYDAPTGWSEPDDEWFELYNTTDGAVDLTGWSVADNTDRFVLPEGAAIPAHGYLVLAYDAASFAARWGFAPVPYGAQAGNLQLSNAGDRLILTGPGDDTVDGMSYGDDHSVLDPPCPDVTAGHSLEREPAGYDTDRALDFVERDGPSPGGAPPATATATPSATPSPSPTAVALLIGEVCYDGTTPDTEGDEFVELYNPLDEEVSLVGYKIGDEEAQGGGEGMYRLPDTARIGSGGVIVVAKNAAQFHARFGTWPDAEMQPSGGGYEDTPDVPDLARYGEWAGGSWALANDGDEVLLLGPGDVLVDGVAFRSGDGEAAGVSGTLSAPAPRSLQRVVGPDRDDMPADFAIAEPNPGQVTLAPPPPASPPPAVDLEGGMRAYWGCLHAHSTYSDGGGPPRYAYAVGRANGLHFLALADHACMLGTGQWDDLDEQAAIATVDGAFIALRAFEWTSRDSGHVTVFNTADVVSRDDPPYDGLAGFYPWLASQEGAIAQFNHPFPGDFADLAYDPSVAGPMALLEVGNGSGPGYRRFEEAYLRALGAGWRVSPANNGDTETPDWGADTPHRTGVVAPALTRQDLLDGLRARRTFATEDTNLVLALRAEDAWMGEILPAGDALQLTITYHDGDGEGAAVMLYDGALPVDAASLNAGGSWAVTVAGDADHAYWARAEQADGDLAYTGPLWVAGESAAERVRLNEFCPAPSRVDWDADGVAGADDEWVELYNREDHAVGLGGWQLDDEAGGGSAPWTFPLDRVIPAHGYLVLFKQDTGVALNDGGDVVRLLRPDGSAADEMAYTRSPGYDRTWSRTEDGGGEWTTAYAPTMGQANEYHREESSSGKSTPTPSPVALRVTLRQARTLQAHTLVLVEGQVTAPPGALKGGTIYIQDGERGMKLYLEEGAYPVLAEGDWIEAEGRLTDYHGEREVTLSSGAAVRVLRPGAPPVPTMIATGELGEALEGLLVAVVGRVTGWGWDAVYLDDGSGEAQVYFGRSEWVRRPWVERGELYRVVGVVSQYASARPYEGGYRLLPRYETDVVVGPLALPVTGDHLPPGLP